MSIVSTIEILDPRAAALLPPLLFLQPHALLTELPALGQRAYPLADLPAEIRRVPAYRPRAKELTFFTTKKHADDADETWMTADCGGGFIFFLFLY